MAETASQTDAASVGDETKVVKASFNLPLRELEALRDIARRRSVSVTQALRQAIAIFVFLTNLPEGTKVLVEEPDGRRREVVFHNFA